MKKKITSILTLSLISLFVGFISISKTTFKNVKAEEVGDYGQMTAGADRQILRQSLNEAHDQCLYPIHYSFGLRTTA